MKDCAEITPMPSLEIEKNRRKSPETRMEERESHSDNSHDGEIMNLIKQLLISLIILGLGASTAQAKEPFEVINSLLGPQRVKSAIAATSKTGKTIYAHQDVEFIYLGGNELWMAGDDGIAEVAMNGLGSGHFEWNDANNRTFVLEISDGDTPPFSGKIWQNNKPVGKFRVGNAKIATDKAGGHWAGVLAFPGGIMMDVNLIVASIGEDYNAGCKGGILGARIAFPGNAYQEASLLHCDETYGENGNHDYNLATLYSDSVTGDTWFLSLSVNVTVFGNLEGEVKAMNLSDLGPMHLGITALARPAGFNL
jgi:hypothetical protein